MRDQIVSCERLSAVARSGVGVAHEINNPLQTIMGCVELMLDELDRRSGSRRDLETVRKEATRAGQIVRNLLGFVHRGSPAKGSPPTSTDRADDRRSCACITCGRSQDRAASAVIRAAPARVNREEIQQVLLNLLLNAEHAIGGIGPRQPDHHRTNVARRARHRGAGRR